MVLNTMYVLLITRMIIIYFCCCNYNSCDSLFSRTRTSNTWSVSHKTKSPILPVSFNIFLATTLTLPHFANRWYKVQCHFFFEKKKRILNLTKIFLCQTLARRLCLLYRWLESKNNRIWTEDWFNDNELSWRS